MKKRIKTSLAVVEISLVCVASLPALRAVVPPPDGGYPGFNTAEGRTLFLAFPPESEMQP